MLRDIYEHKKVLTVILIVLAGGLTGYFVLREERDPVIYGGTIGEGEGDDSMTIGGDRMRINDNSNSGPNSNESSGTDMIVLEDGQATPNPLKLNQQEQISIVNEGSDPYDVTVPEGFFRLYPGQTLKLMVPEPGVYPYTAESEEERIEGEVVY